MPTTPSLPHQSKLHSVIKSTKENPSNFNYERDNLYEQTSLIVTTNLPFAEWPQIFAGDERLAGALLDRLTHHVHILDITGDSYRLKASLKRHKEQGGEPKE